MKDPERAVNLRDEFFDKLNEIELKDKCDQSKEGISTSSTERNLDLLNDYSLLICDNSFKKKRCRMWKNIVASENSPD